MPKAQSLELDAGDRVRVLTAVQEKATMMLRHIDAQINILLGVSVGVFAYASSVLGNGGRSLHLFLLASFAALASLLALLAVHPPRFMRKRGQQESIFYNKRVTEFGSPAAYAKALGQVMDDPNEVTAQYARETYNLYAYYYRPKRVLFVWSRDLFFGGIVLGLLSYILARVPGL